MIRVSCCQCVLIPDIPHAEEHTWKEGDHNGDHRTLGVIGVVNVNAASRRFVGGEQECVEAIENGMKF